MASTPNVLQIWKLGWLHLKRGIFDFVTYKRTWNCVVIRKPLASPKWDCSHLSEHVNAVDLKGSSFERSTLSFSCILHQIEVGPYLRPKSCVHLQLQLVCSLTLWIFQFYVSVVLSSKSDSHATLVWFSLHEIHHIYEKHTPPMAIISLQSAVVNLCSLIWWSELMLVVIFAE